MPRNDKVIFPSPPSNNCGWHWHSDKHSNGISWKVLSLKTIAAAFTLPSLREVKMILSSTILRIHQQTVWIYENAYLQGKMHERNLTVCYTGQDFFYPRRSLVCGFRSQPTQFANFVWHKPHMPHHTTVCTDTMKLMKHDDSMCARLSPGESAMVFHWEGYGLPARQIHGKGRCFLFRIPTTKKAAVSCDIAWVPAWQSHLWWQSRRCVCYRCYPPSARHRWLPELAVQPLNSWNVWTNCCWSIFLVL